MNRGYTRLNSYIVISVGIIMMVKIKLHCHHPVLYCRVEFYFSPFYRHMRPIRPRQANFEKECVPLCEYSATKALKVSSSYLFCLLPLSLHWPMYLYSEISKSDGRVKFISATLPQKNRLDFARSPLSHVLLIHLHLALS